MKIGDVLSVQKRTHKIYRQNYNCRKYEDKGIATVIYASKQFVVLDLGKYKETISVVELKNKDYILTKIKEDKDMTFYDQLKELHEQGYTAEEIAARTGKSLQTISIHLSRSGVLKQKYEENQDETLEKKIEPKQLLTPDRWRGKFCSYEHDSEDLTIHNVELDMVIDIPLRELDKFLAELQEVRSYLEVQNG